LDKINIKNLEIFAYHGVLPEEKQNGQTFYVSAVLFVDIEAAGKADDLSKSVDYGKVSHLIKSYVRSNIFDLIETVAQGLAEKLLMEYPLLRKVGIEIKKPDAPVGLPLETVSVEIERGWHTAYIGLGSNLGDRLQHLRFAVESLRKTVGCRLLAMSKFISTPPYGYEQQGDFLNGCIKIETFLSPGELLNKLQDLENQSGRIRDVRWGPRTLDLDILMYDSWILDTERLYVPHIEMHKRDFVLGPLSEIAPNLIHPIYKKTVMQLLEELKSKH